MGRILVEKPLWDPMNRFRQRQVSYNARRPVNKIPVEMFIGILTEVLAAEWADNPYIILRLSQVCSQWRSVIAGCPLLYRSFSLAHPALTAQHMQRSLALPMDVDIRDVKFNINGIIAMTESISILVPQLECVRSLSVTSHSSKLSERLLGILDRHSSRALTSLTLTLTRAENRASIYLPDLSNSRKHRTLRDLTSLRLCNMNISRAIIASADRWDGATFRLRRLELVFTWTAPPTSATLVHLLTRCPDLQTFTLRSEEPVAYEHCADDLPTLRLANLKKFTYHAPCSQALVQILQHIQPCMYSEPQFDLAFSVLDSAIDALFCARPAVGEVFELGYPRTLRRLDVRSVGQWVHVLGSYTEKGTTSGPDFKLSIPSDGLMGTPSLAFWSWPLQDVSCVSVLTVEMGGAFDVPTSAAQWAGLFLKLHSLEILVLIGVWWIDVFKMFEALEPPSSPNEAILCPNLATVELIDSIGYVSLTDCLTPPEKLVKLERSKTGLEILLRGT